MRTLTMNEIEEVGGGPAPVAAAVPVAVKVAGIIMAGAAALISATASLVTAMKGGESKKSGSDTTVNCNCSCPAPK